MSFHRIAPWLIWVLIGGGWSCQPRKFSIPKPEEFSRTQRERLGDILAKAIASDPATVFLPDAPPYDTSVYDFLQALYDQATLRIHLDRKSPSHNRWNQYRPWKVHVLQDEERIRAFCLPGGYLYLTTALLRAINTEHELYYLMTFEAMLMHQGYVLERLAQEYNSLNLLHIIEGRLSTNGIPAEVIATELPLLIYNTQVVAQNDMYTAREICRTSLFAPTGIVSLLEKSPWKQAEWLITRPSWNGRTQQFDALASEVNCGELESLGMYAWKVRNMLP